MSNIFIAAFVLLGISVVFLLATLIYWRGVRKQWGKLKFENGKQAILDTADLDISKVDVI